MGIPDVYVVHITVIFFLIIDIENVFIKTGINCKEYNPFFPHTLLAARFPMVEAPFLTTLSTEVLEYNVHDFLASRHEITLDGFGCR